MKKTEAESIGTVHTHTHTHTIHLENKKINNKESYKNKVEILESKNIENGITLIALVITIIVVLILAGVSISMLTGQNGILTQASNAKKANDVSTTEEKVKLIESTAKMQAETGPLDADNLVEEITTNYGGNATKTENGFPITAEIDGQKFEINSNGSIAVNKKINEITGNEQTNIITQDSLGNKIVVPAGFEIVNTNDNVENGIIIKDKTYASTVGSEFVWIPVGDIKTKNKGTINIELNRYTFDDNGNAIKQDSNIIIDSYSYTEDTLANHDSSYGNIIAKDIEDFKIKAECSHGYYIGRYEARTDTERIDKSDKLKQVTTKPNDYVYNLVTQAQAATLSQEMYAGTTFESDLMNSYAWDTATLFLQSFGNNSKYSRQTSLSTELENQGTNNTSTKDVECNVYDMASNYFEWSTESYSKEKENCTFRGGSPTHSTYSTKTRGVLANYDGFLDDSFRPIVYL